MTTDNGTVISEALAVLRKGGVILYPTDTVWGLGCDATDPVAVARIFGIKKRSDSKSLVLLASDLDMVGRYVREIPEMAVQLVEVNDKPMTIVYPGAIAGSRPSEGDVPVADKSRLAYNTVAEDGSVGIRIPMMDFCRELTGKFGRPIVSTSANISGQKTPGCYAEISPEILSAVDYVVEPGLEAQSTRRASSIIKVELNGVIHIIRD